MTRGDKAFLALLFALVVALTALAAWLSREATR